MHLPRNSGFTILELMITVAVLVILATVAVPNLRSTIQNNRMTAQTNGFLTAFQLARSEALKRNAPVSVCPSTNGASCTGDWEDGWIVFVDGQSAGSTSASVDEVLRVSEGFEGDASNDGDDPAFIRFLASGVADRDAGSGLPVAFDLKIPDCTGDNNRRVEVAQTGRSSARRLECD